MGKGDKELDSIDLVDYGNLLLHPEDRLGWSREVKIRVCGLGKYGELLLVWDAGSGI